MTYLLSDYPVLARIAANRIKAKRLDARACRWLYSLANDQALRVMGQDEHRFHAWLMENVPAPHLSQQLEALQKQVKASGFRRMADEQAFLRDLSGGYLRCRSRPNLLNETEISLLQQTVTIRERVRIFLTEYVEWSAGGLGCSGQGTYNKRLP